MLGNSASAGDLFALQDRLQQEVGEVLITVLDAIEQQPCLY